MQLRMLRNRAWRGGLLKKGQVLNMTRQECQPLLKDNSAEVYTTEAATVEPEERAVLEKPKKRRRRRANTTTAQSDQDS